MTITRKDYMANSELHQDYYLQFATPRIKRMVAPLTDRIQASTDPHLNDIRLVIWDRISTLAHQELCEVNFKINGNRSASLSDGVCAAKAYARTLVDLKS
jgi:hypothetical protein